MAVTVLVTIVMWILSKPASHATLTCDGVVGWGGGRDDVPIALLQADSRGAVIIEVMRDTYHCHGWKGDYSWEGDIEIQRDHLQINLDLEKK